jgi:twitching motility protein PilI
MSGDAQIEPMNRPARQWLTPTAALARFAPRLQEEHGPDERALALRYGYRVGEFGFLIAQNAGCEAITIPTIARLPTTPPWLLGVANLRGNLVPMFDLPALLEMPQAQAAAKRFGLIFDRGEHAVGILIEEHPVALSRLEPLLQAPSPPAAARDFVSAAYRHDRSLWLELDHRKFFAAVAQRMSTYSAGEST